MTEFVPFPFVPQGPVFRDSPQQQASTPRRFQAVVPCARMIRLDEVSGTVVPVPGVVYTFDYFLLHPVEGAIQRIWWSADLSSAQTNFTVVLVDQDGDKLTEERSFDVLPVVAELLYEQIGAAQVDGVFLRVSTTSQTANLYVTVELLVAEV